MKKSVYGTENWLSSKNMKQYILLENLYNANLYNTNKIKSKIVETFFSSKIKIQCICNKRRKSVLEVVKLYIGKESAKV